ncbi:MAG TPA: hypothetical protein VND64_35945 [Pirellulales bacterium]|nr:hypothetical protein [Pirellulales bacterium]
MKVTCTCGKKLVAGDHLAGKRTKCPHCGAVLTIPTKATKEKTERAEEIAAAIVSAAPSNPKPAAPIVAVPPTPQMEYSLSSAVWVPPMAAPAPAPPKEEYGLQAAAPRAVVTPFTAGPPETAANICPECGKTLAENAVLCVGCGFDLRSGRKLGTRSLEEDGHDRGPRRPRPDRR